MSCLLEKGQCIPIEPIGLVKNKTPEVKILILTMHKAKQYFSNAILAGSDGYLIKDDSDEELLVAIDGILAGRCHVSSSIRESFDSDCGF